LTAVGYNNIANSTNNNNTSYHQHARARSQGNNQGYDGGHPDYPQMSPYDAEGEGDGVAAGAGAGRRVSMPPPARASVERLNGPFVATFS
jgi:hypothetical protein